MKFSQLSMLCVLKLNWEKNSQLKMKIVQQKIYIFCGNRWTIRCQFSFFNKKKWLITTTFKTSRATLIDDHHAQNSNCSRLLQWGEWNFLTCFLQHIICYLSIIINSSYIIVCFISMRELRDL